MADNHQDQVYLQTSGHVCAFRECLCVVYMDVCQQIQTIFYSILSAATVFARANQKRCVHDIWPDHKHQIVFGCSRHLANTTFGSCVQLYQIN